MASKDSHQWWDYQSKMNEEWEKIKENSKTIIPVFLKPFREVDAEFSKYTGLPQGVDKPISLYPNKEEAWTEVASGIKRRLEHPQKTGG